MPFLLALGLAVVLTPVAGRLGRSIDLVDRPDRAGLKIHGGPVPLLGGLAVGAAVFGALGALGPWPPWGAWIAVLAAMTVGLADDVRPLPPLVRVPLQAVAGLVLGWGTAVGDLGSIAVAGVILLVLVTANAVNLVDGQDGLASGAGAIAALALAGLQAIHGGGVPVGVGLALAGSLVGFLVWNRPPARVFLGNGGAYAVGTALAYLAASVVLRDGWRGLVAAGACLGVFGFDFLFSVARRLGARRVLTAGDRLHTYDLVARTAGRTASTVVFWLLGAVAGGIGLLVGIMPFGAGVALAAAAAVLAAAWGRALWVRRPVST